MSEQRIKKIEMGLCEGCPTVAKLTASNDALVVVRDKCKRLLKICDVIPITTDQAMRDKFAKAVVEAEAALEEIKP